MHTAIYPGTFDPITVGHIDIIDRAIKLVDRLVIAVADNKRKKTLFSLDERVQMIDEYVRKNRSNSAQIEVQAFSMLLVEMAEKCKAKMIVRGLRAVSDFEYEFQMVAMNQRLNRSVETVFLMAAPHHQAVSSRLVKEIAELGGNIAPFVPENVRQCLSARFKAPH